TIPQSCALVQNAIRRPPCIYAHRRTMATPKKPKRSPKARPGPSSPVPAGKDPAWRSDGWQPDFDAASLADYVADVVLSATRDAIEAGKHPSGTEQRDLNPKGQRGRKAAAGKRPPFRGWTGRKMALPRKLRRSKMKVKGLTRASGPVRRGYAAPTVGSATEASVTIKPHSKHKLFIGREAKLGVEYFSDEGDIATLVKTAVDFWISRAVEGDPPAPDPSEREAGDS
ncbi:MAG: hypothetical protein IPH07_23625, partial [Deltaproteobacteria bacterium]|nr:hypothetical protein [Deltaproteobacteria bacterium]